MKSIHSLLLVFLLAASGCAPAGSQGRSAPDVPPPILDVHLHALHPAAQGPPPVALCLPMAEIPTWDPAVPYEALFMDWIKNPPCEDPVWSPRTEGELLDRTLAVMERRNVYGVLSADDPERLARWVAPAPARFIPLSQRR